MEVRHSCDPINSLDVLQRNWTIKVVVLRRGKIQQYQNNKGSGSIFKVILMDDEGTQIQAISFNEDVTRFYETLSLNKTYIISNGIVSRVNPQYINVHKEHELKFTGETIIEDAGTEVVSLGKLKYNFINFEELNKYIDKKESIDALGMVIEVKSAMNISKGVSVMRKITIMDMNSKTITLTLWGDLAENEGQLLMQLLNERPIIAITQVAARMYEGVNLQTQSGSTLQINPDIDRANELRFWFETNVSAKDINALISNTKYQLFENAEKICLDDIIGRSAISFKKTHYFFKATIREIQNANEPWYNACKECKKKVQLNKDGTDCDHCRTKCTKCFQRFMMRFRVTDATGEAYLTVFDDSEPIINCPLEELLELKAEEEETNEFYEKVTSCKGKSFLFLIKINNTKNELITNRFVPMAVKQDCVENDFFANAREPTQLKCSSSGVHEESNKRACIDSHKLLKKSNHTKSEMEDAFVDNSSVIKQRIVARKTQQSQVSAMKDDEQGTLTKAANESNSSKRPKRQYRKFFRSEDVS